jgi:hypothetical protein
MARTWSLNCGALGDTVTRRWGRSVRPLIVTGEARATRPDPDRMVEGSRPGFLERFADSYAILADLRNFRGVTPTRRLK